jgi:hypothetical protein
VQVQQQELVELRAKHEANRLTLQEAQRDLSIKMEQYEEEVNCTACRAVVLPAFSCGTACCVCTVCWVAVSAGLAVRISHRHPYGSPMEADHTLYLWLPSGAQ